MIIFSTNNGFDYAEDDRYNGYLAPNDGQCHLDASGIYIEQGVQDPSISQISKITEAHSINVIFAVTSPMLSVYENLSKQVMGSSVATLAENSENVLEMVREEYNVRICVPCLGQENKIIFSPENVINS